MAKGIHPESTATSSLLESVLYSAGTDVGMRREENQDSYGIMLGEGYRLFIVADGMGGVQGGSVASNLTIAVIEKKLRNRANLTVTDVVAAVAEANAAVFDRGNSDEGLNGMGTTFVSLFLTPTAAYTIHVGDSRVYHVSKSAIWQLTEDHTLVQELVRSGAISEEQAEHHPVAHMLTRSVGPSVTVDITHTLIARPVLPGDRFLLCSDGLYNLVKEAEIAEVCSEFSTDEAVQYLIDLANERGGNDNITVIIVDTAQYNLAAQVIHRDAKPTNDLTEIERSDATTPESSNDTSSVYASQERGYHRVNEVQDDEEEDRKSDPLEFDKQLQDSGEYEEISEPELQSGISESQIVPFTPAAQTHRRFLLVVFGFIGGLLAAYVILAGNFGRSADKNLSLTEALPTIEAALKSIPDAVSTPFASDPIKIGPAERTSVQKRKHDLELMLKDIDIRLAILSAEQPGDAENLQRVAAQRIGELQGKIEQLRTDIELAIQQLATWYDRKRRLESSDRVNMASELANTVPTVKSKKDDFEKITWDYLKEVEALRYNPTDATREGRLADLARKRSEKMKELSDEVRRVVERSLENSDDTVAELTLQRGDVERELENSKSELEFARTALSTEGDKKEDLIQALTQRRVASKLELSELEKLLP